MVILKSDCGNKLGGFASVSWPASGNTSVEDENAFVFSFDNKTKHIPYKNKQFCLRKDPRYLFLFGGDIAIVENCDKSNNNRSNLGSTYSLPDNIKYGSTEAKSYLAGSETFRIEEMEIYGIKII